VPECTLIRHHGRAAFQEGIETEDVVSHPAERAGTVWAWPRARSSFCGNRFYSLPAAAFERLTDQVKAGGVQGAA
jgi:hypothetical protein